MTKYEFDNISTEQFDPEDKKDFLDIDTCDRTLIEKKPFTVELSRKKVKLYLYIQDTDMAEYEEDSTCHYITMGVLPDYKSLSPKQKLEFLRSIDVSEEEVKANKQSTMIEMLGYGYGIPLHNIRVEPDKVEHTINSAIAVRHAVSGLIGFELDKYLNRIGNTGWDYLAEYCEGKDLLKLAMKRMKENGL